MFPGGNTNANLGYSKHNQYMAQPPHFLAAPGRGPGPVPGSAIGNPLGAASSVMPLNMQGGIDWAQLAQQWIHMRDSPTAPPMANFSMNMPIAPPPPIISNTPEYHQHQHHQHQQQPALRLQPVKSETHYEEHGEAEMDMDMDEEENENNVRAMHHMESMPPPPVVTQSQWLAGSANDVPVAVPSIDAVGVGTQQWNDWSTRNSPTSHIPSLLKLNVCNPNESTQIPLPTHQPPQNNISAGGGTGSVSSEIDANKRKMLPAWIREGLEKMEREKQRQLEQQQQRSSPEVELPSINVKQVSSKTLTTTVNLLNMSNVASDSEDSIAAPEEASYAPNMAQLLGNDVISKPSNSDEEQEQDDNDKDNQQQQLQDSVSQHNVATVARAANAEAALSGKSYEERLADLMLVVRRTLTEILLETTNEEIAAIATETLKAHRAKASSAQVIRKSALSSITGNLGLAVYGDSSSDSENDESADDNDGGQVGRIDSSSKDVDKYIELSMDELKARIRKSKRAFERVIDDIEERVSLQEQTDEQNLQYHRKLELEKTEAARQRTLSDHRLTDMSAGNVTAATVATTASTNDKLHQFNVKRLSRKERTTRFSDNKDGKQPSSFVSQVAAVAPAPSSSVIPQQLKPVPNPATNLLQIPESMASMLDAANKALDKAQKTSKKSKSRRRQSSSSSSSSSDDSCSSRSSKTNTSSNSSKSSKSPGSSTRSSAAAKKQGRSSNRHSRGSTSHRQRIDSSRKGHRKDRTSSSRQSYERHRSSHESRERERERDRERHGQHYSSQQQHHRRRHRDSSNSASEDGGSRSYRPGSRHGSSRSHQSSSYSKHRERTRSRSNSRSTHNSHSSVSSSHQHRKRN